MNDSDMLKAWTLNAQGWGTLVREDKIPSRNEVTNQAILHAAGPAAGRALDLGCGEGWLTRALSDLGWDCVGADGVASLVEQARAESEQLYIHSSYQDLSSHLGAAEFDLVLANFSLLGEQSTESAVDAVQHVLKPQGRFLIQTLHPSTMRTPDKSSWQTETWEWADNRSLTSSPWYFRSLEDWHQVLAANSLKIVELTEPIATGASQASSIILECMRS